VSAKYYRPAEKICAADVLDGRLEAFGIREEITSDTTADSKCLTDGRNSLWMDVDEEGLVKSWRRYGPNATSKILGAIATTFDTDIFSEHQPQFWGYDSEEEWDAGWREMFREEDEFYG